jgi:hypothetical protein
MKKFWFLSIVLVFILTSCSAIEGVFKAGVWTGVIAVIIIVAIVIFIISKTWKQ